jgi:hypothetical protein
MRREDLLKELERISGLVNEAIEKETEYVRVSALDHTELAEQVAADPDLQRLVNIGDGLVALRKKISDMDSEPTI